MTGRRFEHSEGNVSDARSHAAPVGSQVARRSFDGDDLLRRSSQSRRAT
jgi:hypothetical protein